MNAVGIDVSKGKSMVAALRPMGEVALLPQEFLHTEVGLEQMAYAIIVRGKIPASSWRPPDATMSQLRRHWMSTVLCLRPESAIHQAERGRLYPQGQDRQGGRYEDRQVRP